MVVWKIAEYLAWGLSAVLGLWMVVDLFRVGGTYDEALLLSSREGADELLEQPGGESDDRPR